MTARGAEKGKSLGELVIQDLLAQRGYPAWTSCAIRDKATNVHIATVGNVDRYFEGMARAHAEQIVESVNSHAALLAEVERLRAALAALIRWRDGDAGGDDDMVEFERVIRAARAALALYDGGEKGGGDAPA